jgi:hypothetical protein
MPYALFFKIIFLGFSKKIKYIFKFVTKIGFSCFNFVKKKKLF